MKESPNKRSLFNPPLPYSPKGDIVAGITVGIITIPQAIAYALLAGLPPIYGLYGAFIPLLIYGGIANSHFLNIGPVSVISILVFDTLRPHYTPFSPSYIEAVVILGIFIGLFQTLFGILSLGRYIDLIPKSVISGFIQAAAVVIIFSQFPYGFGLNIPSGSSYFSVINYLFTHSEQIHLFSFFLFAISLTILVVFYLIKPNLPTTISLIFLAGIASYLLDFEANGFDLIAEVPQGLPQLILPSPSLLTWDVLSFLPQAAGIAFLASVGSYIMLRTVENKQTLPVQINREFISLGISKIGSAFFGALPPAGSFNRTILLIKVGGQTQLANIVAAMVILLTLFFLTPVVYYLPLPQ